MLEKIYGIVMQTEDFLKSMHTDCAVYFKRCDERDG